MSVSIADRRSKSARQPQQTCRCEVLQLDRFLTTPDRAIIRWEREAQRERKKHCHNECFETAYFYLPAVDSGTDFSNGTGRWIAIAALTHIALRCRTRWIDSMTPCVINGCAVTSTTLKTKTHLFEVRCVFNGGGRWIRTTESAASRFTVCPL